MNHDSLPGGWLQQKRRRGITIDSSDLPLIGWVEMKVNKDAALIFVVSFSDRKNAAFSLCRAKNS